MILNLGSIVFSNAHAWILQNDNVVELLTTENYTDIIPTEPRLVLKYTCHLIGYFDGSFGYSFTVNNKDTYKTHDEIENNRYRLTIPITAEYDYVVVNLNNASSNVPKGGYWSNTSPDDTFVRFFCDLTFNENEIITIGRANGSMDKLNLTIDFYKY